jgi:hypothetical protein
MSGNPSADYPDPLPPDDRALEDTLTSLRRATRALSRLDSALGSAVGAHFLRRDARQDLGRALHRAARNAARVLAERGWVAAAQAVNLELTASVLRLADPARAACWGLARHPYRDFRANNEFLERMRACLAAPRHAYGQLRRALLAYQARCRRLAASAPAEHEGQQQQTDPRPPCPTADWCLNPLFFSARWDGEVRLKPLQFRLLYYLLSKAGEGVQVSVVMQEIWGADGVEDRTFANALSTLNNELVDIHFPYRWSVKARMVRREG